VQTVDQENASATLIVAAPAARVFALLADPTTHSAIDGTGWVQEAVDWAPRTEGDRSFGWTCVTPTTGYDLAPLSPSETEVMLTYDWSAVPQFIREYPGRDALRRAVSATRRQRNCSANATMMPLGPRR
jgi:hypothetical protein